MTRDRFYLSEGETAALMRAGIVVSASFGPSGVWLNPNGRDFERSKKLIEHLREMKSRREWMPS